MLRSSALLVAVVTLAACEPDIAAQERQAAPTQVAAKAEPGTLSIDAPGFDLKMNIPESIRPEIGADSDIIYPGATVGGLHIAANADTGGGNGSVELRFTSSDPIDKIAAWYRDPGRADKLKVGDVRQDRGAMVISGTSIDDMDPFTIRLAPAAGAGGTEGLVVLQDRSG